MDRLPPWLQFRCANALANSQPQPEGYSYVKLFRATRTVGRGSEVSMQARRWRVDNFRATRRLSARAAAALVARARPRTRRRWRCHGAHLAGAAITRAYL